MLILIIEDNRFSAYCLKRILQSSVSNCQVWIASNAQDAMTLIRKESFDLLIVDGELGPDNPYTINGPELTDLIWTEFPMLQIVGWTDSHIMRNSFYSIFKKHYKVFNENSCWPKLVGEQKIQSVMNNVYSSHRNSIDSITTTHLRNERLLIE